MLFSSILQLKKDQDSEFEIKAHFDNVLFSKLVFFIFIFLSKLMRKVTFHLNVYST